MNQSLTRIFTLGPQGTFSDQATQQVREHLGLPELAIEFTRTIPEVQGRAEAEEGSLGVFPIENSVSGTVGQAQDGMVTHRLTVLWEVNVKVSFSLLANAPLGEITQYYAHPQAFDQCSEFLTAHLPQARVTFTNSNTESGLKLLEQEGGAPLAAIVPVDFAAEHVKLRQADDIQNFPNNTTRFLVARKAAQQEQYDFSRSKTSLLIEPNEDRPGLLHELLNIFNRYQLNLCRLESRPAKVTPWAYVFYVDFNNNAGSADCLAELGKTRNRITVLGSYDLIE